MKEKKIKIGVCVTHPSPKPRGKGGGWVGGWKWKFGTRRAGECVPEGIEQTLEGFDGDWITTNKPGLQNRERGVFAIFASWVVTNGDDNDFYRLGNCWLFSWSGNTLEGR